MGYSPEQLDDLAQTIRAVECDVVVTGTPIDLGRLLDLGHPLRHATYELREIGHPDLADVLAPLRAARARRAGSRPPGQGEPDQSGGMSSIPSVRALIVVPRSPRSTAAASSIEPIAAHLVPDRRREVDGRFDLGAHRPGVEGEPAQRVGVSPPHELRLRCPPVDVHTLGVGEQEQRISTRRRARAARPTDPCR